jgi:tRNA threonylcarbamoyladenosine biosynthesis protein TsaE
MKQINIDSLASLKTLAGKIASLANIGDIILLKGELGSGKTSFAKYFINSISKHDQNVTSPTFNILQIYDCENFSAWHYDFYRIETEEEIVNLGLDDAFSNGVSIIEWPEKIRSFLPQASLEIHFSFTEKHNSRLLTISGSEKWTIL